jgi:hypothetical protein
MFPVMQFMIMSAICPWGYRRYKHFVWLNSSVRGPFFPAYMRGKMHWTRPFTERLRGDVKLVGPSISCGGAYNVAPTPHVQSYLVATDSVGLAILRGTASGTQPLCVHPSPSLSLSLSLSLSFSLSLSPSVSLSLSLSLPLALKDTRITETGIREERE